MEVVLRDGLTPSGVCRTRRFRVGTPGGVSDDVLGASASSERMSNAAQTSASISGRRRSTSGDRSWFGVHIRCCCGAGMGFPSRRSGWFSA